jgi:pimeloyl-ACP methyl ester carboxylesterase
VRSAVLIGQALSRDGETRGVRELMHDPRLADYFRDGYAEASPDGPDHYDVVVDKIISMWRNPLEMSIAELSRITAPVLVMQGDDDGVRVEWNLALVRALPQGQFAVVPGTGHGAPLQRADLVNRMILEFLAGQGAGPPERLLPMGALHDVPAA